MNAAAVYKGFNISINRAQLQKTARLEQWNFDIKTLNEALLFRNTHNTQTAGWREGMSTHTPSCLEPFSTKIAVERWSLNCWLIPWVCLSWTPHRRRRLPLVLGAELIPSRKHLSPSSHSFPSWGTSYKNKGFDCSVLVHSQDALAGTASRPRTWAGQWRASRALLTFTLLLGGKSSMGSHCSGDSTAHTWPPSLPSPHYSSAKGDAFCGGRELFCCKSWQGRQGQDSIYLCTCRTKACTSWNKGSCPSGPSLEADFPWGEGRTPLAGEEGPPRRK